MYIFIHISFLFFVNLAISIATQAPPQSLHALFTAHGRLYFGTAASTSNISPNSPASSLISSVFGQVTPENSMKWEPTERNRGQHTFNEADRLVEFANNNTRSGRPMLIRGHTAIWHSQMPNWVNGIRDKREMETVVRNRVQTLLGRWRGQVYAWDVLNEILNEDGSFRDSVFHRVLGEDFVRIAFEEARRVDPRAKLYINDYNLDSASSRKTQAMARLVRKWRSQNIPIDGIGSQSHLKPGQASGTRAALELLCAAAPECALTEVDIEQAPPNDYATVVKACLAVRNCVGITVWGIRDPDSWRKQNTPLLFDAEWRPKPAYNAILQALRER